MSTTSDTETSLLDVMRPLLALQEHFCISWGLHLPFDDRPLDADTPLPYGESVTLQVVVEVPRHVAEQMHAARQMFEA